MRSDPDGRSPVVGCADWIGLLHCGLHQTISRMSGSAERISRTASSRRVSGVVASIVRKNFFTFGVLGSVKIRN